MPSTGEGRRIKSSKLAQAKLAKPYLKNKRVGCMAQEVWSMRPWVQSPKKIILT
jgi:hypothetical protein